MNHHEPFHTRGGIHPSPAQQAADIAMHALKGARERCQTIADSCMDDPARRAYWLAVIECLPTGH